MVKVVERARNGVVREAANVARDTVGQGEAGAEDDGMAGCVLGRESKSIRHESILLVMGKKTGKNDPG